MSLAAKAGCIMRPESNREVTKHDRRRTLYSASMGTETRIGIQGYSVRMEGSAGSRADLVGNRAWARVVVTMKKKKPEIEIQSTGQGASLTGDLATLTELRQEMRNRFADHERELVKLRGSQQQEVERLEGRIQVEKNANSALCHQFDEFRKSVEYTIPDDFAEKWKKVSKPPRWPSYLTIANFVMLVVVAALSLTLRPKLDKQPRVVAALPVSNGGVGAVSSVIPPTSPKAQSVDCSRGCTYDPDKGLVAAPPHIRVELKAKCWDSISHLDDKKLGEEGTFEPHTYTSYEKGVTVRSGCPGYLNYYIDGKQVYPKNEARHPESVELVTLK